MSSGSNKRPLTNSNIITTTTTNQTESVNKTIAQFIVDARLHAMFEESGESGKPFDYSQSIRSTTSQSVPKQQITAYLSKIQRGGHIQPFGCMIAVDDLSFRVIAFSENATEMLDLTPQSVPTLDKPQLLDVGTNGGVLKKKRIGGVEGGEEEEEEETENRSMMRMESVLFTNV